MTILKKPLFIQVFRNQIETIKPNKNGPISNRRKNENDRD